ncbi:unnamed protein product [Dicrocoelium dendriticum]|nr:unnamed protein product [Dicrocoelium dendriticum]
METIVVFKTTTSAMLSISLYLVITEVTTTNGMGTTPIKTTTGGSMKPTDGATKAVIKFPITFLIVIIIFLPEVTTTNGMGTTLIKTTTGGSMKPTDGATKAVIKFPITFLVAIFICELLVPFS